nr:MAG TPA: hypothetical protein [Caudoviricetes sp.]
MFFAPFIFSSAVIRWGQRDGKHYAAPLLFRLPGAVVGCGGA